MEIEERSRIHAALGDPVRLRVVDALRHSDRTVSELVELTGIPGNLFAHHLDVLSDAGVITRRRSEGDRRRRYVSVNVSLLHGLAAETVAPGDRVVFVCTHNSARSQFAAAMWGVATGTTATSAGSSPAERVHPKAVEIGREFGVDLTAATPQGYEAISVEPDLVISVCDRARETEHPDADAAWHWSIPDPVAVGTDAAFRAAFSELTNRITEVAHRTSP